MVPGRYHNDFSGVSEKFRGLASGGPVNAGAYVTLPDLEPRRPRPTEGMLP
jgi:hypothetical protein